MPRGGTDDMNKDLVNVKGIVREFDNLGRIVIPKEYRDTFDFGAKAQAEIIATDKGIFIRRHVSDEQHTLADQLKSFKDLLPEEAHAVIDQTINIIS
jgi:bifunctional DNA-binding transcriptional regulator/antitoxin component of YhaV-PrlF toxin-antitoxin module